MAMNSIGRPPLVQPKILEQFQKNATARSEDAVNPASGTGQPGAGGQKADRVQISSQGQQLVSLRQTLAAGREAALRAPDVRQEKLAQVRSRLQSGYYDSAKIADAVAARVGSVLKRLESL